MRVPILDKILVGIQILILVAYIFKIDFFYFEINIYFRYFYLLFVILFFLLILLSLIQLNKNLTAYPTPKQNAELIKKGVYKYVRHPIYSGIILIAFFYGLFAQSSWKIIISILLFFFFLIKSQYEEKQLEKKYNDYIEYKKHTSRFFPFIL